MADFTFVVTCYTKKLSDCLLVGVLEFKGLFDTRQFEDTLVGIFNQGIRNLVIDTSKVKYIGSTGMGLVVKLTDKCNDDGGKVVLVGTSEKTVALFEMLGITELFTFKNSMEEALQYCLESSVRPGSKPK